MDDRPHIDLDRNPLFIWLKERNSGFLQGIAGVMGIAEKQLAHQVPRIFPHYTKHDIGHSLRVLSYMVDLVHDIDSLTELEVAILIHSAVLHDIGMALGDQGIEDLKADKLQCCPIKFSAMLKLRGGDEKLALQDIVRISHADISADRIVKEFSQYMTIPDMPAIDFCRDVATIAQGHTRDPQWVTENISKHDMKGSFSYNPRYLAHILRIADLLDFDSRRTPLCLYHLIAPGGLSKDEWATNFAISNTQKIKEDKATGQKKVVLFGECRDAHIHRKVLKYIGWIESELDAAIKSTEAMPPPYRLFFRSKVDSQIKTIGYSISDYKIEVDFNSISSLLMGERIYGDRRLGLRELVQNSIDACRVRKEIDSEKAHFGDPEYQPKISVILDKQYQVVIVRDNGCGMTEKTIREYFLNIGQSYYSSEEYLLQDLNYKPIGAFGIGFLSCFMLSDKVSVQTRHYETAERCDIEFERGSEFISFARHADSRFEGTEVHLNFNQFMKPFDDKTETVQDFLSKYILTGEINLEVIDRDKEATWPVHQTLGPDKPGKGETEIDTGGYLKNIQCVIWIKRSGTCVETMRDLNIEDSHLLLWNQDELKNIDDCPLSELVHDESLMYLTIEVFSEKDRYDFDTLYERFGYLDDIIDKFQAASMITICFPPDMQYSASDEETDCDPNYELMCGLTIGEVLDSTSTTGFVPRVYAEDRNFLKHPQKDLYLPYHTNRGELSSQKWNSETNTSIFVRDILIDKASLPCLCQPSTIKISRAALNITDPRVYPDISRNSFDESTKTSVTYAFHKAAIASWRDSLADHEDERNLIDLFIQKFYRNDRSSEEAPCFLKKSD